VPRNRQGGPREEREEALLAVAEEQSFKHELSRVPRSAEIARAAGT